MSTNDSWKQGQVPDYTVSKWERCDSHLGLSDQSYCSLWSLEQSCVLKCCCEMTWILRCLSLGPCSHFLFSCYHVCRFITCTWVLHMASTDNTRRNFGIQERSEVPVWFMIDKWLKSQVRRLYLIATQSSGFESHSLGLNVVSSAC